MLAHRLIHTAMAFLVIGVAMGLYMGGAQDFRLTHVHVHINLLGWMTLGMVGLLYLSRPELALGWIPVAHYWLHLIGLLVFMGGFAWSMLSGEFRMLPVAVGSSTVGLAVLLLTGHVFRRLR